MERPSKDQAYRACTKTLESFFKYENTRKLIVKYNQDLDLDRLRDQYKRNCKEATEILIDFFELLDSSNKPILYLYHQFTICQLEVPDCPFNLDTLDPYTGEFKHYLGGYNLSVEAELRNINKKYQEVPIGPFNPNDVKDLDVLHPNFGKQSKETQFIQLKRIYSITTSFLKLTNDK